MRSKIEDDLERIDARGIPGINRFRTSQTVKHQQPAQEKPPRGAEGILDRPLLLLPEPDMLMPLPPPI